jgi:hypothetical protein
VDQGIALSLGVQATLTPIPTPATQAQTLGKQILGRSITQVPEVKLATAIGLLHRTKVYTSFLSSFSIKTNILKVHLLLIPAKPVCGLYWLLDFRWT